MLWLPFILIGAMGKLEFIWNISDTLNGLMALPNLIALLFLSGVIFNLTKDFLKNQGKK
jgi:AGCS family alanine or glycine:cation symporter